MDFSTERASGLARNLEAATVDCARPILLVSFPVRTATLSIEPCLELVTLKELEAADGGKRLVPLGRVALC